METTYAAISNALRGIKRMPRDEKHLQSIIADIFDSEGIAYVREERVTGGFIDFAVDNLAVEIKMKGSPVSISRQLIRYLQEDDFTGLILITTKPLVLPIREVHTPRALKPIRIIDLWRNFF